MVASWQHRQQVLLQQVVDPANLKQHLNYSSAQLNSGNKVTRVYYRVVNQGPSWRWLHVSVVSCCHQSADQPAGGALSHSHALQAVSRAEAERGLGLHILCMLTAL